MRRKQVLIVVVIIAVLLVGALIAYVRMGNESGGFSQPEPRSQLTGNKVSDDEAERPILAVIIENTPPARPQTGLNNAAIVFEAVTEGGITRYLALYQEEQPEIVGPVRSLRVDSLDWAMGFEASIAHVGGRPKALKLAEERDARSMSQFKYDAPYYRDDQREAPHNMYARTEGLRALQGQLGHSTSDFDSIPRSNDMPRQNPEATNIGLEFSNSTYRSEFRYDKANNSYARYLAGSPHASSDADRPILVKNLIIITQSADRDTDDGALGSGEAIVFKDGGVTEARWSQDNYADRIKFSDKEGNDIPLNRGKTWIAALSSSRQVIY